MSIKASRTNRERWGERERERERKMGGERGENDREKKRSRFEKPSQTIVTLTFISFFLEQAK